MQDDVRKRLIQNNQSKLNQATKEHALGTTTYYIVPWGKIRHEFMVNKHRVYMHENLYSIFNYYVKGFAKTQTIGRLKTIA